MNGTRLSVLPVAAAAIDALGAAQAAEQYGIDGFWYGTLPGGTATPIEDTYVLTTLAGVAARTTDIRLGAILDIATDPSLLTSVEDIGVLDQASGGRLEVALRDTGEPDWYGRVATVMSGWHTWPTAGEEVVVTPRPFQPQFPWLIVREPDRAGAEVAGAGDLLVGAGLPSRPRRRTVLTADILGTGLSLRDWLGADPVHQILDLRSQIDLVGADEVLVPLSGLGGGQSAATVIAELATVLAPVLRCTPGDIPGLLRDALRWDSGS